MTNLQPSYQLKQLIFLSNLIQVQNCIFNLWSFGLLQEFLWKIIINITSLKPKMKKETPNRGLFYWKNYLYKIASALLRRRASPKIPKAVAISGKAAGTGTALISPPEKPTL